VTGGDAYVIEQLGTCAVTGQFAGIEDHGLPADVRE
jgi:hypothetical protein